MLGCKGLNCELVLVLGFSTAVYYIIGSSSCEKLLKPLVNRLSNNPPPNNTFISLLLSSKPTNDWFNYIIPLGSARARTTRNNACVFPFVYKGRRYTSCSRVNSKRPWCAITPNYDVDKLWGYCRGRGGEDYLKYQEAHCTAFSKVIEHTTVLDAQVILNFVLLSITKFFHLLRERFSFTLLISSNWKKKNYSKWTLFSGFISFSSCNKDRSIY